MATTQPDRRHRYKSHARRFSHWCVVPSGGGGLTEDHVDEALAEIDQALCAAGDTGDVDSCYSVARGSDEDDTESEAEDEEEEDEGGATEWERAVLYVPSTQHNIVAFVHSRELRQEQSTLATAVDGESAKVWSVDDEVEVKQYIGRITELNADGTYDLAYDEGGGIANVDRGMLMRRESIAESRMRRKRPALQRKQDIWAANEYETLKSESLQNAERAKAVTFGLLCKPIEAAVTAVAVRVLTDVPADGSLRMVPAPNGNPLRDPEYIRAEDIIGGIDAVEKPRDKKQYFESFACLSWQAEMHAEQKKRLRIAHAVATPL